MPCLKIVYVFYGHRRRADVREHLESLAQASGFTLDVLQDEIWANLKDFIRNLQPFCVIATPPCSTCSRTRHFYKVSPGLVRYVADSIPWVTHGCLNLTDRKQKKEHCLQSPFSPTDLQALRESWFRSLPDPHNAAQLIEGQPFFLHALAKSLRLRLMGDPDADVIDTVAGSNFVDGVHVGHIDPLGPTPQVTSVSA